MSDHEYSVSSEVSAVVASWGELQAEPNDQNLLRDFGRALGNIREDIETVVKVTPDPEDRPGYGARKLQAILSRMGCGPEARLRGKPRVERGVDALGYGSLGKELVFDVAYVEQVNDRLFIATVPFSVIKDVRPTQNAQSGQTRYK